MNERRWTIELRHLRYAIEAAEQGSFRKAAASIGVQVSAVSRRIRDLEDEIGAALFIRHQSGVHLTHAGELFLRHARRAIGQISSAKKNAGAIGRGEHGEVRVGISAPLTSGFLAVLVETYASAHSDVRLDFFEGIPSDHIQAIRKFQIDIAFLVGAPNTESCQWTNLWTERIYVVMPYDDPLAAIDMVRWEDLRNRKFVVSEAWPGPDVHDYIVKNLGELGYRPSIELQAVFRDTTLMQIVAGGRGLTLASEGRVATQFPGVACRQLSGGTLPYCAIWSPDNKNPAFRHLLTLVRELAVKYPASHAPKD